jgi:hypothetical protein
MRLTTLLLIVLLPAVASGQTLTTDLEGRAELWPTDDRCYQHRWGASANVGVKWGPATVESWLGMTWWGACDQKIPGNPLNAESGKVLQRSHGVRLWVRATDWLRVGAAVQRDAVHHIWRSKRDWRHSNFPRDNSWRGAQKRCSAPEKADPVYGKGVCPSIGYWDGLGPIAEITLPALTVYLDVPVWSRTQLTLPPPAFIWTVTAFEGYRPYFKYRGEMAQNGSAINDFELGYRLTETISVGVAGGVVGTPGWRADLRRVAFVIRAD